MSVEFMQKMASSVRRLIASGQAVHVTESDAVELDLLAGLPWPISIHPNDIALSWLRSSKPQFNRHGEIVDEEVIDPV